MGGEAPHNPVGPPPGRPAIRAVEAADLLHKTKGMISLGKMNGMTSYIVQIIRCMVVIRMVPVALAD